MPFPIAAAIGAGSALLGGGINAASTANQNRKSRDFAREMYQRQWHDSVLFWNMQNSYNSPQAQMKRFQEAGLNPHLMYGGVGGSGNAGPISTPDVQMPQFKTPEWGSAISDSGMAFMNAIYDMEIKQAQVDNLRAQNDVIKQDAIYRAIQTEAAIAGTERTRVGTEFDTFRLDFERNLAPYSADIRKEQLRQLSTGIDISINRDAREAAINSSNIQEAVERMATMREQRAKSRDERVNIRAATSNIYKDGIIKDMEIGLRKQGINPNDPMWSRIVGKMLSDYFDSDATGRSKGVWQYLFDKFKF